MLLILIRFSEIQTLDNDQKPCWQCWVKSQNIVGRYIQIHINEVVDQLHLPISFEKDDNWWTDDDGVQMMA